MIINKDSWHYKLVKNMSNKAMPTTLCSYFWTVVGAILEVLSLVALSLLAIGCIISVILVATLGIYVVTGAEIIWVLGCQLILIKGALIIYRETPYYIREMYKREHQVKARKPSLLMEYLRAKKEKVCPYITYK